jgi:uncharacterized tellurite resistance protein B-like protein
VSSIERFRILASAALVDGSLATPERAVLSRAALEMGVPEGDIDLILSEVAQGGGKGGIPKDAGERSKLFRSLVDLFVADGKVTKEEETFFFRIAPKFGLDEQQADMVLRSALESR